MSRYLVAGSMISGQLPPRRIAPQLGFGLGLGLVLGFGGNFPWGNCPRTFAAFQNSISV